MRLPEVSQLSKKHFRRFLCLHQSCSLDPSARKPMDMFLIPIVSSLAHRKHASCKQRGLKLKKTDVSKILPTPLK
jgi:hypothetical protein